jgi:hypothetical protein
VSEEQKADTVEAEVVEDGYAGASASSLVRQGQALMRAENDSLLAVATQRPRDEAAFIATVLKRLDLAPEQAKGMFYSIPYRDRAPDGSVKIVRVEGPSIGAALALAQKWGNCTATARAVNEDSDGFDLEGVFIDLESNFRVSKAWRVSKLFRRRDGRTELLNVQRLGLAIQAGLSKGMRNAILAGIPSIYVQAFYQKAKEIAGGKLDALAKPETVTAIIAAFDRFGVPVEKLETYCDDMKREKWTGTDVANLRGLWNALNDKQVTVAELFDPKPEPHEGDVTITPANLSGAAVESKDDPDRAEPSRSKPRTR